MNRSKGYVDADYLRLAESMLGQLKQRSYEHMRLGLGHRILDVGCGPGTDTIPLAQLIGSTGQVWAMDYDDAMVAEAKQRAGTAGVSAWVTHRQADATSLPFDAGYFDSCRSERLFQHLLDPSAALAEMVRVTKADGWVVVLDTDWGSGGIDTDEIDVERRLVRYNAEEKFHNGYAGRQLYRLFKTRGLAEVSFEVVPIVVTHYALARQIWDLDSLRVEALAANVISADELRRLEMGFEEADADGVFFGYGCMILVAGRRMG